MKRLRNIAIVFIACLTTACSNWLEILPQNAQSSDSYWVSKEDVEAVVTSGYVKLRACMPHLIDWGELRGGSIYAIKGKTVSLQTFRMMPSNEEICNWQELYEVVNMANSVLMYGPGVLEKDPTFNENAMKSYMTEAYFQRSLAYFYLVRNWRDVPLILTPYVNDATKYDVPQSADKEVLAQIKKDILTALETGAAKEAFDDIALTKGRATKWALYALMADVCLWTEDYKVAEEYCDKILNGEGAFRPVFVEDGSKWFEMYYPGNSNESIFEIQWNQATYNQKNNLSTVFGKSSPTYYFLPMAYAKFKEDFLNSTDDNRRGNFGTYVSSSVSEGDDDSFGCVWKYTGAGYQDIESVRTTNEQDPNFIIYRVAEIILIKAEAAIMQGQNRWDEALELINKVRRRSGAKEYLSGSLTEVNEETMLGLVLSERNLELSAEGKRWYDVLRFGKMSNYKYRDKFLINEVTESWAGTTKSWITSVLSDNDALYLPVWQREMETNKLLIQNQYYQ